MDNPGTEHRFRIMCMKYSRGRIHKRDNRRCAGFQFVPLRTLEVSHCLSSITSQKPTPDHNSSTKRVKNANIVIFRGGVTCSPRITCTSLFSAQIPAWAHAAAGCGKKPSRSNGHSRSSRFHPHVVTRSFHSFHPFNINICLSICHHDPRSAVESPFATLSSSLRPRPPDRCVDSGLPI